MVKNLKLVWLLFVSLCVFSNDLFCETTQTELGELPDIDSVWNYNDPHITRDNFLNILKNKNTEDNQDYHLQLLTQIARTYGLQGKFDSAHLYLDKVKPQLNDKTKIAEIRYLLELGRTFRSSGFPEKGMPLFDESYQLGRQINADYLTIDAAHMMALVVKTKEERLTWSKAGVEIAENSQDKKCRHWLGSIYNNIGWDYHEAGDFKEALQNFEKALNARIEEKNEGLIDIAKWCYARCLRSLNMVDSALAIQEYQYEKQAKLNKVDGYVCEELGELYLLKDEYKKSVKFFALAYQELSKDSWMVKNEAERLERIKKLGNVK